jgi:putative heme iron utilization protein
MASEMERDIVRLVAGQRWGALASLEQDGAGAPLASMIAYATGPALSHLLFFVSGLAAHTRNLLADSRASLAVGEPDRGEGDPQTLPRVSLSGRAVPIEREDPAFGEAWRRYVARFPDAEPRLALADFVLFRFTVEDIRYVGGFARAARISAEELQDGARELGL